MTTHIHLIAICGTGMGSLAGLLKNKGFHITGSDANIYPPMSTQLAEADIPVYSGFKAENLNSKPDLVIIGNAVSKDNPEVLEVLRLGIPYLSFPQALSKYFITGHQSIVIAGTHGKTTTTSLMAHALEELGQDPGYLIGGVLQGGKKNIHDGHGPYFAVEGDEYDTAFFDKGPKFLHYQPYHVIITSLEFDHADIYRDLAHITESFEKLIQNINPLGKLLVCAQYPNLAALAKKATVPTETYGFDSGDWQASNIAYSPQKTTFDISYKGQKECTLESPLAGQHNVLNNLAVYALLRRLDFNSKDIKQALESFLGIKRRQEIRASNKGFIVIDDFAHHPTAIKETIAAIKDRYPEHTLWAIFEPRSNTSKRAVFQNEFANCFARADRVIIASVFMPEKVKDGKILDVPLLVESLNGQGIKAHHLPHAKAIEDYLKTQGKSPCVFLIMSNGAFDGLTQNMQNWVETMT